MGKIILAVLMLVILSAMVASANIGPVRPMIVATRVSSGALDMSFIVPPMEGVFDCEIFVADGDLVNAIESACDHPANPQYWPGHLYELGFHKISDMTVSGGSSGEVHYQSKWDGHGPHTITVAISIRLRQPSADPDDEQIIWLPTAKTVTIP
jgi:hypothetical protein